jgi:hypothetical protein
MAETLGLNEFIEAAEEAGIAQIRRKSEEQERVRVYECRTGLYKTLMFLTVENAKIVSAQMFCGFATETTLESVNSWNQKRRFVKAYKSKAGVALELDIIGAGLRSETVEASLLLWSAQIADAGKRDWTSDAED